MQSGEKVGTKEIDDLIKKLNKHVAKCEKADKALKNTTFKVMKKRTKRLNKIQIKFYDYFNFRENKIGEN